MVFLRVMGESWLKGRCIESNVGLRKLIRDSGIFAVSNRGRFLIRIVLKR